MIATLRSPTRLRAAAVIALIAAIAIMACAPAGNNTRVARSTLVVGIDVSGSFKPNYENSIDFAANYLYARLHGLGGLRQPTAVIVGSIGGRPLAVPAGHRVVSRSTAAELRNMLRGVLADGGTASGASINGYDLAGKTGTASVVVNGKYSTSDYIASFIGMVPARAPKLVVTVMVDEPQGSIFGGSVAAPAFQKIVGWAVPYLGISPR